MRKSEEKWYRGLNKTQPIGYRQLNKEYRPGSMPSANVEAFVTCSSLASLALSHLFDRHPLISFRFRLDLFIQRIRFRRCVYSATDLSARCSFILVRQRRKRRQRREISISSKVQRKVTSPLLLN